MGTLAVVELPMRSGLAKDKIVNTLAIAEAVGHRGTGAHAAAYATAIARFFTANVPTYSAVGEHISAAVDRSANACQIKLYDITGHLDGSPHGSPYAVTGFTMPAPGASNEVLPEEVAFCVTLEAKDRGLQRVEVADGVDPDAKPDRPRQRFTGRTYIGPMQNHVNTTTKDGAFMSRPSALLGSTVRGAMVRLAQEIEAIGPDLTSLGVWSRKDQRIRGIDTVRTDDAWDTQRRRGASPTSVVRITTGELIPEVELAA